MADVFEPTFVWPPNWQGSTRDAVTRIELSLVFRATTTVGQSAVVLVDPAQWDLCTNPRRPAERLGLDFADFTVGPKVDYVRLYWDYAPQETALICPSGRTERCWESVGGKWGLGGGGTGKLMLEALGVASGGSYEGRLKLLVGE